MTRWTPEVAPETLSVTHIFDGEEVVTGGPDGQTWIATFKRRADADFFVCAYRLFAVKQAIAALTGECV